MRPVRPIWLNGFNADLTVVTERWLGS